MPGSPLKIYRTLPDTLCLPNFQLSCWDEMEFQPPRRCIILPSVAVTQERLRWVVVKNWNSSEGVVSGR